MSDLRLVQGTPTTAEKWKGDRLPLLRHARVPPRYQIAFEPPAPWPEALPERWGRQEGDPWALLFNGPPGTGKTMLGVEMLARAMWGQPERDARFRPIQRGLFLRCRELANLGLDRERREEYELAFSARVLLLDDLGRGYSSGAAVVVGDVLSSRYDQMLPTIVTISPGEDLGDEAIASRFRDAARIQLTGDDRRGG